MVLIADDVLRYGSDMRLFFGIALGLIACCSIAVAQTPAVAISAGYQSPPFIRLAPGQLVTLYIGGLDRTINRITRAETLPLPTMLDGISVELRDGTRTFRAPILAVAPSSNCLPADDPACATTTAVTLQVPFDIGVDCACCLAPPLPPLRVTVLQNGVARGAFPAIRSAEQIHVVRFCDSVFVGTISNSGCSDRPAVTHADGTVVDANRPARPGEVLVAYLLGLGRVNAAPNPGEPTPAPSPASVAPLLAFDFAVNAPGKQLAWSCQGPTPSGVQPLFAGLTQGFIGLYQVNFVVPPAPAELPACDRSVTSNLTVTFSSFWSSDAAQICVAP